MCADLGRYGRKGPPELWPRSASLQLFPAQEVSELQVTSSYRRMNVLKETGGWDAGVGLLHFCRRGWCEWFAECGLA